MVCGVWARCNVQYCKWGRPACGKEGGVNGKHTRPGKYKVRKATKGTTVQMGSKVRARSKKQ